MFKAVGKDLKVNADEFRQVGLISAGASAVGILGGIIILLTAKPDTYICLGSIIAFLCIIFLYVFIGIFGFSVDFNLALSMGVTRKAFAVGYYIRSVLLAILMCMILAGVYLLEAGLYGFLFPQIACEMPKFLNGAGGFKFLLLVCILVPALRFILGAFVTRFQKMGFWVVWALWMLLSIAGTRIANLVQNPSTFLGKLFYEWVTFFRELPGAAWYTLGVGVMLLFIFGSWLLIRRQKVTCA